MLLRRMELGLPSLRPRGCGRVEADNGSTPPACFGLGGPERFDERAPFEEGMDDFHLNPFSFTVDDPYFPEPLFLAFQEVIL